MSTIFDRWKIDAYRIPQCDNMYAHSPDIASVAVRVAAATYAFTSDLPPGAKEAVQDSKDIPFRSLKQHLAMGDGASDEEWYTSEGGSSSFTVSVVGGAVYGVLLGDLIIIGFRGTSEKADWAINLFGLDRSGPMKIPLGRMYDRFVGENSARAHAGLYRVAQALRRPVYDEIKKLQQKYRNRNGIADHRDDLDVILTGHSLGGALALLAGIRMDHASIYTFGMPRVCESGLIADLPACHYRYVLEGDPVPNLPPESFGFRHDMPCLKLDPYRGLQKPGLVAKALRGFRSGKTISGSMRAAAKAILANEHDMELYVDTVMKQ